MENFKQEPQVMQGSKNDVDWNDARENEGIDDFDYYDEFVPTIYDYLSESELGHLLEALGRKVPFLNLCTYTGFNHIFGNSKNEDLTRRLLNELIKDRQIKKIEYVYVPNPELVFRNCIGVIYLRCKDGRGQYFYVVLLNIYHETHRDGYFLWAYWEAIRFLRKYGYEPGKAIKLPRVYVIEFLSSKVHDGIGLMTVNDRSHEPYLDNEISDEPTLAIEKVMTRFTFELPKIAESYEESNGFFEKLCFCIGHIRSFDSVPADDDPFFKRLFEVSRLQNLDFYEIEDYFHEVLSRP